MITAVASTPTRIRYGVLLFVYLAAFITYLDRVCISIATPAMQKDLGLSQIQFGWVFTVFYIAYGVCEIPTSCLGDRWGQRRMLIRIVGCWSAFTVLTGLVRNLPELTCHANHLRSGGGRRISNPLASSVTLVSATRTKPRKRDYVDGSPIRRRARASACGRAHRIRRMAIHVCNLRSGGIDLVCCVRALVSR